MSQRSLAEWLAVLEVLHPSEIDMGLDRVRAVAKRLDVLRPAPRVFTVTGTNGKGSTCAALDSLLRASGMRTGCYTSPHLHQYNERIRLNGKLADDQSICDAFAAIDQARGDISLTYFEFGTLAAFWLFQRAGLDAVVLEVGLGGRLDAVNVVDADVAVVTSIGLDHQEYLGSTRESVAFEKAGIMRASRPVVSGERDLPATFTDAVARLECQLYQRDRDFRTQLADDGSWVFEGVDGAGQTRQLHLPAVSLPRDNLAVALQAFWAAGLDLADVQVAAALQAASATGRLEARQVMWQGESRDLRLDVGHNPHAARFLAESLRADAPRNRVAVFGLLADKDLDGVVAELRGVFSQWFAAPLPSPRSRSAQVLSAGLSAVGERVASCDSIAQAIELALDNTDPGTEVVIFGSFFCVADAILWLSEHAGVSEDG
ncbi:bifunctional tetrahydrofolate synthase/dihydrofolate synthase [Halopseudomonas sp.]|uniref:bifunctional tetrahydrofolate synthase/dihydrofolate synthase n=1 Tax=Halopseudomonas sp. TaxID=2901191 RepID=UPI00311DA1FD